MSTSLSHFTPCHLALALIFEASQDVPAKEPRLVRPRRQTIQELSFVVLASFPFSLRLSSARRLSLSAVKKQWSEGVWECR